MPSSHSHQQRPTNTVVGRVVPPPPTTTTTKEGQREAVLNDLDELQQRFSRAGSVMNFVLFKSMRRAVVVYEDHASAQLAQATLHNMQLTHGSLLSVAYAEDTPLIPPASSLLAVPPNPKAFFTSPPPSPPEDWEPAIEPPPVANDHPHLLRQLELLAAVNDLPSIVVEDVDFDENNAADVNTVDVEAIDSNGDPAQSRSRIPQTRRPPLAVH